MPLVRHTIKRPAGERGNARVSIRLIATSDGSPGEGHVLASSYSIGGTVVVKADGSDKWEATLEANTRITPAGTVYEAIETLAGERGVALYFTVPDGAGPYDVEDNLLDPPTVLPSAALQLHLNAHSAATIPIFPEHAEGSLPSTAPAGSAAFAKTGTKGFVDQRQFGSAKSFVSILGERLDVKTLGAIGDGALHPLSERYASLTDAQADYPHATALTDPIDWAAIQLAQDRVEAVGGGLVGFPHAGGGVRAYVTNGKTLTIESDHVIWEGAGWGSWIFNTTSDLLKIGTEAAGVVGLRMKDIRLSAYAAGTALIEILKGISRSYFQGARLDGLSTTTHIVKVRNLVGTLGVYYCDWLDCDFFAAQTAIPQIHPIDIAMGSRFANANNMRSCRLWGFSNLADTTTPRFQFIRWGTDSALAYCFNNKFESVALQGHDGGFFRGESVFMPAFEDCWNYDAPVLRGHGIRLLAGAGGLASSNAAIKRYNRTTGVRDANVWDVYLENAVQTNLEHNGGLSAPDFRVNVNNQQCMEIIHSALTEQILNRHVTNAPLRTFNRSTVPNQTIDGELDHNGTTAGFMGAIPVTRRALGAAASDPATTQALANTLRQALIDLGLGQA